MAAIHTQKHWLKTPRGELFVQSWVPSTEKDVPLILLHDSLGCVALWRDFPERLAETTGRRVVAYDRLGFGRSGKHPSILSANFICEEANEDFVSVCRQLGLRQYVTLGHSVGGGMAICCASVHLDACKGVISVAAQAFVDAGILDGIRAAKQNFSSFAQIDRLKKYHGEKAAWVLNSWIETWLSEAFYQWSLDSQLPLVRCPALILHGDHDEYGSEEHPKRIAKHVSGPVIVQVLRNCGHVPHREYPKEVLMAIDGFLAS